MSVSALPAFLWPLLEDQYGPELARSIVQGYEASRPVTLRVNALKATVDEVRQALEAQGIQSSPVAWSDSALVIHRARERQLQALEIYSQGKIYLQSLSSMVPPIVLAPRPGADLLDMAAAPGGKTTQMAAMTANRARITACEIKPLRAQRLKYNLQKQGATSVCVMVTDARRLDPWFSFDQILLDAPCSGSGILSLEDPKALQRFTPTLLARCQRAQLALLQKALALLKPGGDMVYSTCSVLAGENEAILTEALKGFDAEVEPIAFPGLETLPQLPTSIPGTLCLKPDGLYQGFFVAKLSKTAPRGRSSRRG